MQLCHGCKNIKAIAFTDQFSQLNYCADCHRSLPLSNTEMARLFLLSTIPYSIGDVVECRTAGVIYDGIGRIDDISMTLERGCGTPVYPSFHVTMDKKAKRNSPKAGYYHEACLTLVKRANADA